MKAIYLILSGIFLLYLTGIFGCCATTRFIIIEQSAAYQIERPVEERRFTVGWRGEI